MRTPASLMLALAAVGCATPRAPPAYEAWPPVTAYELPRQKICFESPITERNAWILAQDMAYAEAGHVLGCEENSIAFYALYDPEAEKRKPAMLQRIDANHDRLITDEEVDRAWESLVERVCGQ